jgi:putative hydrolase of the HAD superfamily
MFVLPRGASKSMYQAVIFDRDGVLTDFNLCRAAAFFRPLLPLSMHELAVFWQEWGQLAGFPRDLTEEEQFWRAFWDHLSDELSLSDEVRTRLQAVDYVHFLKAFPESRPALQAARKRGLKVGVLSNFTLASLESSLQAVGLADLIDVALAAPVLGVAKPEARSYLAVAEALQVDPGSCLFFDDERPCVQGALAVGMHAYLVDRRRSGHSLAEYVVSDLSIVELMLAD